MEVHEAGSVILEIRIAGPLPIQRADQTRHHKGAERHDIRSDPVDTADRRCDPPHYMRALPPSPGFLFDVLVLGVAKPLKAMTFLLAHSRLTAFSATFYRCHTNTETRAPRFSVANTAIVNRTFHRFRSPP